MSLSGLKWRADAVEGTGEQPARDYPQAEGNGIADAIARSARKRKRRRRKKRRRKPQAAHPVPVQQPAPPPLRKQQWIVGWDDSRGDGLVRAVYDGVEHDSAQDPATIPPRPLPTPQNPPAPKAPQPMGVYSGPFGRIQANRLLWRAGFGPRPGEAAGLADQGLEAAVHSLTRTSGYPSFSGPEPTDGDGYPIAPYDAYGHDHLWWLDRMVRSSQPLVERMALVFHDWFATSNEAVNQVPLMVGQTHLFRNRWAGSFRTLLEEVTKDPAMLVFLDGISNSRNNPNENYAREVMELFALGADRGAYTEDDIRELAKALTGWRADWNGDEWTNFRYDANRHSNAIKSVFSYPPFNVAPGNWTWQDAIRLAVEHPMHPSFFVGKLWSYFVPAAPSESTMNALTSLYTSNNYEVRPVLEAILMHPDFYEGPPMVKPPIVYLAGLMRSSGTYVNSEDFIWVSSDMGQQLFYPPNVSGWDDQRWLDTNTMRGRWEAVREVLTRHHADPWNAPYDPGEEPGPAFNRALGVWDYPPLRAEHHSEINQFAHNAFGSLADWQNGPYRALRQNALLQLIAVCPDLHLS